MNNDYQRIEQAIRYLQHTHVQQPLLDEVASAVNMSPSHFQRLFKRWVGVSPKRYLQYLTVEHAKQHFKNNNLLGVTETAGLSSVSRLHDHFITIEAVSPGQYKSAGSGLKISYGVSDSPFGLAWLASTSKGICALEFISDDTRQTCYQRIQKRWPNAELVESNKKAGQLIKAMFSDAPFGNDRQALHLMGSNFQIQVWKALLNIPFAALSTYQKMANSIGRPTASRAVAQAIGSNSIAFLIPCHRVLRSTGDISGYRWGVNRKQVMIAWEGIQKEKINHEDTKGMKKEI